MKITKLAIDFGNTNTVVYIQSEDKSLRALAIPAISVHDVILSGNTTNLAISTIPSEVYNDVDRTYIGKQAFREVEKSQSSLAYSKYGINFKKSLLALQAGEDESQEAQRLESLRYGSSYLSRLCSYIKDELEIEHDETENIPSISLAVPVSAPLEYRSWLKEEILKSLSPEEITIFDEATCAAFSYNDSLQAGDTILVVDIGGSTTDFSLVEICRMPDGTPASRILARDGLRAGGVDIDRLIADHIIRKNELDPFESYSQKSQKRILRLSEKAKKFLTLNEHFVEELYDPDLGVSIAFLINRSEMEDILANSAFANEIDSFFARCRHLVEEANFQPNDIRYAAFIGGSFLQPFLCTLVSQALEKAELPSPRQAEHNKESLFYAVACGAIKLSGVKLEGQRLLNSIFLRTGPAQEVNFKLLFEKGDSCPASSKDFALGKVDENQTHFKFWLAELDGFQDLGKGAKYRPITYNGSFYRMKLPSDAVPGDFRFITRFHIDEDLKISVSMFDEEHGLNIYSRLEIGNHRSDAIYLDSESRSGKSLETMNEDERINARAGREKILISDERFTHQQVSFTKPIGQQVSETKLIYSRPDNKFEAMVEQEIMSWSYPGWLITGCTIPGSPWKPDHILILENGVIVVIEDKNYAGEWIGLENGPWRSDGHRIRCGSTRGVEDENPLVEVDKSFWAARQRACKLGIETDPFVVRLVVAPIEANINGVVLEKDGRLVRLDGLYSVIDWAKRKQDDRIMEKQVKKPTIATPMVCAAFGITP